MKELGMAMSEYFYEYAMIGTLDMAYPSNQATFGHLGEFSKDKIQPITIKPSLNQRLWLVDSI